MSTVKTYRHMLAVQLRIPRCFIISFLLHVKGRPRTCLRGQKLNTSEAFGPNATTQLLYVSLTQTSQRSTSFSLKSIHCSRSSPRVMILSSAANTQHECTDTSTRRLVYAVRVASLLQREVILLRNMKAIFFKKCYSLHFVKFREYVLFI